MKDMILLIKIAKIDAIKSEILANIIPLALISVRFYTKMQILILLPKISGI